MSSPVSGDQADLEVFGQRLREVREHAGMSQPQLAEQLGVQRQTISSWEQGSTAPDVKALLKLKQVLRRDKQMSVAIGALLGEVHPDARKTPLEYPLYLLQKLDRFGIRDVHPNRSTALIAFLPFLQRAESDVCLVASSLLGVTRVAPESVSTALLGKAPKLKVLMTHPDMSAFRERQEGRSPGSISKEIEEYANKLLAWGVPKERIRFYRGAPTIFLLFTDERMLANPYTYNTEAFKTVTLELAPVASSNADDIHSQYARHHFHGPWDTAEHFEDVFKPSADGTTWTLR